jgi:hypothetical protein
MAAKFKMAAEIKFAYVAKKTLVRLRTSKKKPMARKSLREVSQFVDLGLTMYAK